MVVIASKIGEIEAYIFSPHTLFHMCKCEETATTAVAVQCHCYCYYYRSKEADSAFSLLLFRTFSYILLHRNFDHNFHEFLYIVCAIRAFWVHGVFIRQSAVEYALLIWRWYCVYRVKAHRPRWLSMRYHEPNKRRTIILHIWERQENQRQRWRSISVQYPF